MKITLANYKSLAPYYALTRENEPLSPLTYAMWDYFGYHTNYEVMGESLVIWSQVDEVERPVFMMPYCRPEEYRNVLSRQRDFMVEKAGLTIDTILLYGARAHLSELVKDGLRVVTNYLYEIEKMKFFAGAALQKKRNNYNFFDRNYGFRARVDKLTPERLVEKRVEIEAFLDASAEEETGERRFLRDFLDIYATDAFTGALLWIDDALAGITVGYTHGDYYEIFVEKCVRDIRGAYQYLLSNNLQINDIACRYMDRQDDANVEGIRISKESYHPVKKIERVEMRWKE